MNPQVKKLSIYLIKAIVIFIAIDFIIGLCLGHFFNTMQGGERSRANYVINESKDDLLIMGSSRAWNHYVSKIFQDTLKVSAYNAGRSAQSLLYQVTLLEMILERHTPKIIILDVNENDLVFDDKKYDIFKSLMPYYKSNAIFKKRYDRIKPEFKFFGWSNALIYNSAIISIIYRNLRPVEDTDKGFKPLKGGNVAVINEVDNCNQTFELDNTMSDALTDFVSLCGKNKIKLIMVLSPRASVFKCEREDYLAVKNLIAKFDVPCIDFVENKKFRNNLHFMHDPAHLNGVGALEFSSDIAHLVKIEINK